MSRESEFVKNTAVLSLGRVLPKFTAFITLPILTNTLYLSKAEFGTYDLITVLVMLVIPVATLQVQTAAFRFLIDVRGDHEGCSKIISEIFCFTVPISLTASIIVQFFFTNFGTGVRVFIALYFFFDMMRLIVGQIARGLGYNKVFSMGAILLSVVYTICVVVLIYVRRDGLLGVMIALTAGQIAGTLYPAMRIRLWSYFSFANRSSGQLKALLKYSWPMVPNNLSSWVLKLSDRFVITGFLGVESNAVYAAATKIPSILTIVQNVLLMAWQENASLAVHDADAGEYFSKMFKKIYSATFGFTAALIAGTPILFRFLINPAYDEAYYQMPVLILGMFFFILSAFIDGIYAAHKRTVSIGISTVIAAGINLAVDFAFVNVIGIWAGSISTLAAYLVLFFYRLINVRKFQPFEAYPKMQALMLLILCGMLALCYFRIIWLDAVNLVLGAFLFFYFNRELIRTILKKIRKRS